MNACFRNRRRIAWLALGALDARTASAVRDHLARCEGCRRYWEETSNVIERLAAAELDSSIQASESFHQRVAEELKAAGSRSVYKDLTAHLGGTALNWRVALPATTALVIAVFVLVALQHRPAASLPTPPRIQVTSTSSSFADLAPTIANYEVVANQSLDKLDELLTEQGNRRLPPAPIYTASTFKLASASF
jgi:anti-sigma factor RsiW